ncbi:MAG: transposase [Thermoplasmatales archaeon]|nr:transposase [Thermoplasmatales archaeon]
MKHNKAFSLGGIVMIEKVEKTYGVFSSIFKGVEGNARDFIPQIKLLVYNKLTHSVSAHQIPNTYPSEAMEQLGMKKSVPAERSIYRTLERVGKYFPVVLDRYQDLIVKHGLVDKKQIIDFSSSYLEGNKAELGMHGYSRDRRPDKPQVNFGISTGINSIPTALTIQKGNVQDKKHMKTILKLVPKVIPKNSLLIFDAGANTKPNKEKIRKMEHHYLTLKPKKVKTYKRHIKYFERKILAKEGKYFEMNERHYYCVKKKEDDEINYIFFCPELYETQIKVKEKKFKRQKEKGNKMLRKRKTEKIPSDKGWVELIPSLQKTLFSINNPYVNGTEGFFILESSVDTDPEKILRLYKEKDKAEKFIRALKEGLELRPIRHWNEWCIIGLFFICFLANFMINLTMFLAKNPVVKNAKLLKKFLINLTETVVYPEKGFRFHILSNVSPQILSIFGDFVYKFEDKSLSLRW